MPDFAWQAVTASGETREGVLSAVSSGAALKQLRSQGLTPLRLDDAVGAVATVSAGQSAAASKSFARKQRIDKSPVKSADILAMTAELAIMLRAGLALDNALRVLIEMSHKPSVAQLNQSILTSVKGGTPLSRALAEHSSLFGDFYINMIRSGEVSGKMSAVLDRLVEHMERQRALRDSVISATIYPAILLVVSALSLVGILAFVVPQFEKLFTDMGDALPLPTRLVMTIGQVFTQHGMVIGIVALVVGAALVKWLQSAKGRLWWQTRMLRLPLLGDLTLKYQLTLFARSMGTLLGNGVPVLTALHIATETVGNPVIRQCLARIAPIVKEGGKVIQGVSAAGIFEPLALNLIRVGEETGRVGSMMLELATILNRDVENGTKRLLTLLGPAMILILGVSIAFIIISILLGILSINDLAI